MQRARLPLKLALAVVSIGSMYAFVQPAVDLLYALMDQWGYTLVPPGTTSEGPVNPRMYPGSDLETCLLQYSTDATCASLDPTHNW